MQIGFLFTYNRLCYRSQHSTYNRQLCPSQRSHFFPASARLAQSSMGNVISFFRSIMDNIFNRRPTIADASARNPAPSANASSAITITYTTPDSPSPVTATYDFLIVACDPRFIPLSPLTPLEKKVNDSLVSSSFRTALHRAIRPSSPQLSPDSSTRSDKPNYVVRFNPGILSNADGRLYAFRDEVFARSEDQTPSPNGETWVTTYQFESRSLKDRDLEQVTKEFDEKRMQALKDDSNKWLDFKPDEREKPQPEEAILVDYFPHFEEKELNDGLPWKVFDEQGRNSTLYVSSFTCFESVLHCFLYGQKLMASDTVLSRFPEDKNARIAVVGAGPSGLLFASQHLLKRGYTNFDILEKQDRFGGKTFTFRRPAPVGGAEVPCELGTCYLSIAYEPMFDMFREYDVGDVISLDRDPKTSFRSVVDAEVAKTEEEKENGVSFGPWTVRKNGPFEIWEQIELFAAGVKYFLVHYAVMGMTIDDCMPVESPDESTVVENLQRLVRTVLGKGDVKDSDEVPVDDAFEVLKKEKQEVRGKEKGLFDMFDSLSGRGSVDKAIAVKDLKKACRDVFHTSFAGFLDRNGMDELKSVFLYAYQVQGYGTLVS